MSADSAIDLSVVIPIYNEEDDVGPLLRELFPILHGLERSFEVLCVDDASADGSVSALKKLQNTYAELRISRHKLNCGESAASATGFSHARGQSIVTMDGDQQNDPADIPFLLKSLETADVVCGIRKKREDNWVKRTSSQIANGFRNRITGDSITDSGCTFRALRAEVLQELPVFNGMHRFLPTLLRFQGYKVIEIEVKHRPRTRGQSKYGIGNR